LCYEFSFLSSESTKYSKLITQNSKLDYFFLLNPDTEVVGDAIARLVDYMDAHPDVAVIGPRLCYPNGGVQPSRRRFPTVGVFFWESTPLEQRWPNNPWARRYRYAETPDDAEQEVDWLVGAALLVRRSAIERAGLLDAGFQMYSEELEWQRRIQRLNVPTFERSNVEQARIVYLPSAVIIHHEGKSSEQAPAQRYLNFQRSRIRDARMIYGARFAGLLGWFLRAAYAAELAAEAAKWLLGHKRRLRAQRIKVYWRVIRGL
jgi:N-acetylglucosaminyl-diphospho-decaprenol L-rhamnosyltransferase